MRGRLIGNISLSQERSPLSVGSLWHWMVFWQWNKSYFIYLTKERWYICMSYLYSTYTTYQFVSKCLLKLAKSCGGNGLMVVLRLPPDLQISTCQWHSMNTFGCTSYTNSCNKKLTVTIPISCDKNHIDIFFGIDLMQLSLDVCFFLSTPRCQIDNCCRILHHLNLFIFILYIYNDGVSFEKIHHDGVELASSLEWQSVVASVQQPPINDMLKLMRIKETNIKSN